MTQNMNKKNKNMYIFAVCHAGWGLMVSKPIIIMLKIHDDDEEQKRKKKQKFNKLKWKYATLSSNEIFSIFLFY